MADIDRSDEAICTIDPDDMGSLATALAVDGAITDDRDRLASLSQYQLVTEGMNDRFGEEDPTEWAAHRPSDQAIPDSGGA